MHGWGVWSCELHHDISQLYCSKATSTKQHGYTAAGSSSKLAQWGQRGKLYLGHHSQPSNTALWGTQQTGLAFHTQAATLRDNWLHVTMQSNNNTVDSTEVRLAVQAFAAKLASAPSPPFYEYQFIVYLRNIISSKSNKHSFCVGTAHYFPDRCMRDGCRVELQQEMCHLSGLMTERSILMTISRWLTALLGGLQPYNLHS